MGAGGGCRIGGAGSDDAAVGIELPAIADYPPLHAAVVVRPAAPDERYVEPLAQALTDGLRACRGQAGAALSDGLSLSIDVRAGRLAASHAEPGLGACLTQALSRAAVPGLGAGASKLSLWLRAAESRAQ